MVGEHESVAFSNSHVSAILQAVGSSRFDVILANDEEALSVSIAVVRRNCPVVIDAHEYPPMKMIQGFLRIESSANIKCGYARTI